MGSDEMPNSGHGKCEAGRTKLIACSMTGFGASSYRSPRLNLNVEIKTVNSRFLDLVFKLPSVYSRYELAIADLVRERLKRGRVEIAVNRQMSERVAPEIRLDESAFMAYLKCYDTAYVLAGLSPVENRDYLVREILRRKEVTAPVTLDIEEVDEAEGETLKATIIEALDGLRGMREREGEALAREVERWMGEIRQLVVRMRDQSSILPQLFREKLLLRISHLGVNAEVDPQRLAQEIAYFADRGDVTEEIARLFSHLDQVHSILAEGGGRKMEFLLQEMGREVNTIGSKSQGSQLSELVIATKAILEKVREQIQNIE